METPTLEQVKEHFKNAKIVRCLDNDKMCIINSNYIYKAFDDNFWCKLITAIPFMVFNTSTKQYAEIIEYKSPTLEQVKEHFKDVKIAECLYDGKKYYIHGLMSMYHSNNDIFCDATSEICLYNTKNKEYAKIIEYKEDVKDIEVIAEEIEPKHYDILISNKNNESIKCDVFDISNAMNLSREQTVALRYFRVKGDTNKQINDTEKCIHTLKRYIDKLKTKVNNE